MMYRETFMVQGAENAFELTVFATEDAIVKIGRGGCAEQDPSDLTHECIRQLREYFDGCRREFDFPVDLIGTCYATQFRLRVWGVLRRVPFGQLVTYGELAAMVGDPKAARAVGGAVGANPILIAVPCHRVVASKGIGGFSVGLDLKRHLLDFEGMTV